MIMAEIVDSECAVALRGVGYTVHGRHVVRDVDLAVPVGSVFALLGDNRAGKSTLLRLITGELTPTSGAVRVFDERLDDGGRAEVGFEHAPGTTGTGRQHLAAVDAADPDPADDPDARIDRALARIGLDAVADVPAHDYGAGDRRRLGIAAALLRPRGVLALDDPFDGLDAAGVADVVALCGELAADGVTMLLAARPHPAIERIVTHAGILAGGRLVAAGDRDALLRGRPARIVVRTPDLVLASGVLGGLGVGALAGHPAGLSGVLDGIAPERVAAALVHAGVRITGYTVEPPSLGDLVGAR